jgi:DNA repair protein RecO
MYSVNNTQAIVLKSFDSGEKDSAISLFTKDFGQLYAKVSGVRDIKSKHRYALQDHSLINVSLIQGKTGWRITSSSFVKSFYFDIDDKNKREKILQILSLVKRFYLGEEGNAKIFEDLLVGFEKISNCESKEELELKEAETVIGFLFDLGYVEKEFEGNSLKEIRKVINESIQVSSL